MDYGNILLDCLPMVVQFQKPYSVKQHGKITVKHKKVRILVKVVRVLSEGINPMTFHFLNAMSMKRAVFSVVAPCSLVDVH
jgi:hypothetical protein